MLTALVKKTLDLISARDIEYGEVRASTIDTESWAATNGRFTDLRPSHQVSIGVRLVMDGAWGFAGTTDLTRAGIKQMVRQARQTARALAWMNQSPVKLANEPTHQAEWTTPIKIDPWQVPMTEKKDFLLNTNQQLYGRCKGPETVSAKSRMEFYRKHQIFASTQGAWIRQTLYRSASFAELRLFHKNRKIRRSYPGPGGNYQGRGYESALELDWEQSCARLFEEAKEGLRAPDVPEKKMDVLLKGSILALQIHETIGHAVELDRVYGYEDNLGGRTYLEPAHRNELRVGSPIVDCLGSDAKLCAHGAGTVMYDDEGVPARATPLIEKGIFTGYLTSRETAGTLGLERSNGCAVASDALNYPLVRMTNVSLLPGRHSSLKAMIASTEDGLLMDNESSWSIDDERASFQIGAEIGWHIRGGKIKGMFRHPVFSGRSIDFWRSCDAIAGPKEWVLWGFSDCTKGAPPQLAFVSHGASPARFRGVQVGK
ncbi:MAG: TldD/PmbA family protein [Candidatus Omnitrophica bacterium]|nr:TldD/PmbA family protein [Candidatus Omnitrophota bacterium]